MEMILLEDCCDILDSMRIPVTAENRKKGEYPYYGANGIQDYVADYIFDDELVLLAEDGGNFGSKERPIAYRVSGKCWVNNHAHVLKPKEGLDVNYLCYSLMFYKVDGMVNGATRQKLTQAAMRKMLIPKRTMEEQMNIVDKLNRTIEIKKKRQIELDELENLIKSRFVEMFGDPLDKQKVNMLFTNCVIFNPKKSEINEPRDTEVSFVPMECVGVDGSFSIKEDGVIADYYDGYTYFRDGDVLLAKITPCFENGKVAIAEGCTNGIGFGTTEFHVSRPIEGISNSEWIKYLLRNDCVHELAVINMTGSAGQKRIQTPFFSKLKIYLPPIELQNDFAAFVQSVDKIEICGIDINDFNPPPCKIPIFCTANYNLHHFTSF